MSGIKNKASGLGFKNPFSSPKLAILKMGGQQFKEAALRPSMTPGIRSSDKMIIDQDEAMRRAVHEARAHYKPDPLTIVTTEVSEELTKLGSGRVGLGQVGALLNNAGVHKRCSRPTPITLSLEQV